LGWAGLDQDPRQERKQRRASAPINGQHNEYATRFGHHGKGLRFADQKGYKL
jgi:hypothetical protein